MALTDCLANEDEINDSEMQCILNVTVLFIYASPQTDYNTVTCPRKFTSVAMSSSNTLFVVRADSIDFTS